MQSGKIVRWTAGAVMTIVLAGIGFVAIRAQADPGQTGPTAQGRQGPGRARGFGPLRGGPGGPGGLMPRVSNLTDAQRDQMKSIADSHRAELQPLMEQLRAARVALDDAIVASPVDDATIRLKSGDVANAEADLAVARAHINAEMMKVLTPEQTQELQSRRNEMKQRVQDGRPSRAR